MVLFSFGLALTCDPTGEAPVVTGQGNFKEICGGNGVLNVWNEDL